MKRKQEKCGRMLKMPIFFLGGGGGLPIWIENECSSSFLKQNIDLKM